VPQPPTINKTATLRVGSTGNQPELEETVSITARDKEEWKVVLSLGQHTQQPGHGGSELPLPDLEPGDLLLAFAELEVTTDAPTPDNPGLIGTAYTYDPTVRARFLLARDENAHEAEQGRAIQLDEWSGDCSQAHHHSVLILQREHLVAAHGLGWDGDSFLNLAISATSDQAEDRNRLLIGENEDKPVVDQDTGGIRAVRFRPGDKQSVDELGGQLSHRTDEEADAIPVAKKPTIVFSEPLHRLRKGEQLVIQAALVVDARDTDFKTRVSTRLFLADSNSATEPSGAAERVGSWKGHVSKENGGNCMPADHERTLRKFGVLRVVADSDETLFLNMTATSSAPDGPNKTPGTPLPVKAGSFLEITRYAPDRAD
jgi:hypothetical protein